MADKFINVADHPAAPATRVLGVAPNDTNPLADLPKALFVGTGGSVVIAGVDGVNATFRAGDGALLPIRAAFVRATGTTAADIVALY